MKAKIQEILKHYWGYEGFRSLQEEIIISVLNKRDTLALMPTGGGKSITYQVPALAMEGICVVVTPLIALMKDQVEDLRQREIAAEAIYTGMSNKQMESSVNKAIAGKLKFLYVSPERLASGNFRGRLRQMPVALLAVDEAHCISQWGYDFRPSYLRIAEIRGYFPAVPVLALTATATPQVIGDIQFQLKFREQHVLSKSFRRDNISYVVRKANDKLGELLHILTHLQASAIVYVRTRNTAVELAKFLEQKGIKSDYYHAGLTSLQREQKQEAWKQNRTPVIVATNAFGMGIDKPDVRIVVHFDIPDSPEAYFQEAGRAGRDGNRAYAVLLYNEAALTALKKRIVQGFPELEYVRTVYHLLGSFLGVEEGCGAGLAFEFDAETFVRTFKLEAGRMQAALRVLQVAGYLECTTEVRSRSRISFMVLRDQLYKIDLQNSLLESLVELILRTFSGIFVDYAYIEEQWLADKLGTGRQEVYEALLTLSKRKIISYIPGNDRPYVVYYQPRVPASYLHFSRSAYDDRKQSYAVKIDSMVTYIKDCPSCRQLFLMEYFGQKEKEPCGICDLCLERKKQNSWKGRVEINKEILEMLKFNDIEIKDLLFRFESCKTLALEQIRILLDEEKIYYKTPTLLSLYPRLITEK